MSFECVSYWIEHHPGLASWVQAFGSILAIIVAFLISNIQLRRQYAIKKMDAFDKAQAFKAVVKCAADHAIALGEYVGKKPNSITFRIAWEGVREDTVEAAINSLSVLPAHELGASELVVSHNNILGALLKVRKDCRKLIDEPSLHGVLVDDVYISILGQCKLIERYWEDFEATSS